MKRAHRKIRDQMRKLRYTEYENHDCLTSQIRALEDRLRAIERRLPPEPLSWRPHDPEEYNADLRSYIVHADGTRTECDPDPAPLPRGARLHTYVLQDDGTTREAIP